MPFQEDTPIVTAAEVEAHTHETDLGLLDQANATLESLRAKATNAIALALKLRGVDPGQVENTDDFKFLASWWIVGTIYASKPQGDEENTKKADFYLKKFEDGVRSIFIEGPPGDAASIGPPVPRAFHLDEEPNFARPTHNRRPWGRLWPFWRTM
jgi:hypothetical protein